MDEPIRLDGERQELLGELRELRRRVAELGEAYRALPESGLLLDTEGVGALTTPGYCLAGAREIFEETLLELDAAADALDRAGTYTARLRGVPWPAPS